MKQIMKRSVAMLIALVLCVGLLPVIQTSAVSNEITYVYGSNGYIYNWGVREETATVLSPNAEAFYTGDNTYDVLSSYAGGTGTSDAPDSALYSALQDLMVSNHTYKTSYDATKTMYQYTDCENSGGKISSFYSGTAIGPSWGSSPSWNREHTWPDSKGLDGNDENDIMMLRPTASSENSSRGNKAYGVSSGYYNPNSASGGKHDLRGDVARIFLYVYVRWGNVNGNGQYSAWGSNGVIESVDVLLQWIEADPVDTWELGRNDSVESITGTRNVFVDYPEFAFILFGEEIPNDMTTPSGEASNATGCDHNYVVTTTVAATCTGKGYTVYTCSSCGKSYQDNFTEKTDHNYVNGTCTLCKATESGLPGNGDKVVIYAPAYSMALSATKTGYYNVGIDVSEGFGSITDNETWVVTVNSDGTYSFVSASGQKLALADSYSSLNEEGANDDWNVIAKDGAAGIFYIKNTVRGNYLEWYAEKNNWSSYATSELSDLFELKFEIITDNSGNSGNSGNTGCAHSNTAVEGAVDASCTVAGHTGKTVCTDCGATVNAGSVISATGHSYVSGTCSNCGKANPNTGSSASNTVSVAIEDYATANGWTNSTMYNSLTIDSVVSVAVSGGVNTGKFYTNGNNWRVYQSESPSVVITASGATIVSVKVSYESNKTGVLTLNGANVASDEVVTVNASSVTFSVGNTDATVTNGQARITAIEVVYASASGGDCAHTETFVDGAVDATCSSAGHTGKTVCADCGETLDAGEKIAATGHNYVSGTCSVCGKTESGSSSTGSTTVKVTVEDYAASNSWENSVQYNEMKMDNVVSVAISGGQNTGKFYTNGNNWRVYQSESPSIVIAANDATIVSVKVTYESNKTGVLTLNGANVESAEVVNVNASSVTFGVGNTDATVSNGQVRITAIEVVYATEAAEDTCQHTNTKIEGAKAPTCTVAGHTGKTVCTACGATVNAGSAINATGHNYVNGTCSTCGAVETVKPNDPPKDEPAKGTAYYAVMNQANLGKKLYFTGAMDGYYLGTTEDASAAAVLYKEEVSGGFKLYFYDGDSKLYINLTDRGNGKAGVELSATAAAVFTMDEAANTPVAVVAGNTFYLGTYNEYVTFSASSTSYITGDNASKVDVSQFPLRLEAIETGDDVPAAPKYEIQVVAKPQPGESYMAGMAQSNLGTTLYITGNTADKSYRLETTENPDEAVALMIEVADGGYYLYFMKDGVKTYIELYEEIVEGEAYPKGRLKLTTEKPATVLTYSDEFKTFIAVFGENSYYMGTYNTYNTVSVSSTYYITGENASSVDVTQFPLRMYQEVEVGNSNTGDRFEMFLPICIIVAAGLGMTVLVITKRKFF